MTAPMLLPLPQSCEFGNGEFLLDPTTATVAATGVQIDHVRAVLGIPGLPAADASGATIRVQLDESLEDEGYHLEVAADGITATVGSDVATVWAMQTLRQLMPAAVFGSALLEPVAVREAVIDDAPRFGWRGGMLDVARHYMPLPDLMRCVEQLSAHKMNRFHIHLADDQGWRFESHKYPKLTEVGAWRKETIHPYHGTDRTPHGGFYTQEQLRRLVKHAQRLGVTIVPELDFPGHATAALAAYPEFSVPGFEKTEAANFFDVIPNVLNLTDECMTFVRDLFAELLDVFPGQWIHIGGDEVPRTQWQASEHSAARAKELGLESVEELQQWFTNEVVQFLREKGRTPLGWDEVADNGPIDDMVCHAWRAADKALPSAKAGMDVIVAPVDACYFDYYPSTGEDEAWCIGGLTDTRKAYEFEPTKGFEEVAERVLGTQFQLWTEYVSSMARAEYMVWPRGCATAEVAWSEKDSRDWDDFSARLEGHLERLAAADVNFRPESGPLPWQQGGHGRSMRGPIVWA